jgi:transcriptional regulator GlxA family with amidase domain
LIPDCVDHRVARTGAGIGAEIDLMAFFISRYFGLKAYGKIYGLMRLREVPLLFTVLHGL